MKYLLIIFTILINAKDSFSQANLVMNGSFEDYDPSFQKNGEYLPAKQWWDIGYATPDYFHPLHGNIYLRLPNTAIGYILPQDGIACMGIVLMSVPSGSTEHIQGELSEALLPNREYKVSFWVKPAYESIEYYSYNIGLRFETNKANFPDHLGCSREEGDDYFNIINPEFTSHISNPKGHFLTDTTWTEVSGIYKAHGGERYISIGTFWDDTPQIVKAWEKVSSKYYKKNGDLMFWISKADCRRFMKIYKVIALMKNPLQTITIEENEGPSSYYLVDNISVTLIEK